MARILFTAHSSVGHVRALVPAARIAAEHGHTVALAAPEAAAAEVAAHGVAHLPAGLDMRQAVLEDVGPVADLPHEERVHAVHHHGFAGRPAPAMAADLVRLASEFKPEVIVREPTEFGGYLAAELLGLPHVTLAANGGTPGIVNEALLVRLGEHHEALGVLVEPSVAVLYRYLHGVLMPPAFDPSEATIPNACFYQQTSPRRLGERLPEWVADLDPARPVVLAALGTTGDNMSETPALLRRIGRALDQLDVNAVLVAGKHLTGEDVPGSRVRVVEWIAQPLMLEIADLFLTHAGFNSVRESLRAGVPLVAVPRSAEQPQNAARCQELGVAQVTQPSEATATAIHDACAEVLGEPRYLMAARALQRSIVALPPLDTFVADLVALT
ncbi:hypothetical protein GCM10012275_30530 [Longimycelium tulufanense]|uniref:Erythromycin biosynthesis protein CIII-like C-terminal domain-containing protein n=1 Tax=Longimycelium tulufanense TaxID=907463 RepID=A0A8J3FVD8_9PSEU|nr:glycosyltransferase [Longimycelium tulufanense]GGM57326.1 hypothetical protein GCM10012275_30530 [Longimycelium tulufanense]